MTYELAPGTTIEDLPHLDVFGESYAQDPLAFLNHARQESWIYRSERGIEVLDYEPVAAILKDRRLEMDHHASAIEAGVTDPEVMRFRNDFLVNTNGANHVRMRAAVSKYFSKDYAETLRVPIRQIIENLFDDLEASGSIHDLFDRVCQWVPALTYGIMIDAPTSDAPFIARMSDEILRILQPGAKQNVKQIEAAYRELFAYTETAFERATSQTNENLLTHLQSAVEKGKISHQEALDLAVLTLEASTDNTSHEMGLVAYALLKDREMWQRIVQDQSLIPQAVNEALRILPRIVWLERIAMEDLEWRGLTIPKGTLCVLSSLAASHDPNAYASPGTLDIDRIEPKPSLMFGGGMTVCLGQHIARVEIQEFISVVASRYPGAELSNPDLPDIGLDVTNASGLWTALKVD